MSLFMKYLHLIISKRRKALFYYISNYSNDYPADESGEQQNGEIAEYCSILKQCAGCHKLAQIMAYTACHADSHHAEESGPVKEIHYKDAEDTSCQGIDHAEHAAEEKSGCQDPGNVDGECISEIHPVDRNEYYKIGDTQFDPGNWHRKRYQHFYIAEYESQSGKHSAYCHQSGVTVGSAGGGSIISPI